MSIYDATNDRWMESEPAERGDSPGRSATAHGACARVVKPIVHPLANPLAEQFDSSAADRPLALGGILEPVEVLHSNSDKSVLLISFGVACLAAFVIAVLFNL